MTPAKQEFSLSFINSRPFIISSSSSRSLRSQPHSLYNWQNNPLKNNPYIVLLNNQCQSNDFLRGLGYNYVPHIVSLLTMKWQKHRTIQRLTYHSVGTQKSIFAGAEHSRCPCKDLQHDEYLKCETAFPWWQLGSQLSTRLWFNHLSYEGISGATEKKSIQWEVSSSSPSSATEQLGDLGQITCLSGKQYPPL